MIIVISGPGGVGKGTIVRELCERDSKLAVSRSWTTRKPRVDDKDDSYFLSMMKGSINTKTRVALSNGMSFWDSCMAPLCLTLMMQET